MSKQITAISLTVFIVYLNASSTPAQVRGAQNRPQFEVASVKPLDISKMRGGHEGHRLDSEVFVDRTELFQYIVRAYLGGGGSCLMTATPPFGFRCPLISGSIPEWVKTDRWEIQGKIAANALPDYSPRQLRSQETPELNLMLQALLEDRFRLKTHWTTKELPAYALTIDKKGAKLKPSSAAKDADKADGRDVHGMSGIETDPMPDGSRRTRLTFQASSMGELAKTLSIYFDRQVVDRTGLNGEFDFTLEYEEDSDAKIAFNPFSGLTPSTLSDVLRSIGLGLESTKARREVLVIDHVEKPSSN